jgi:hypothetical protein
MRHPPRVFGLLYHPKKPESAPLAKEMQDFLQAHGCTVWIGSAWDEPEAFAHIKDLDILIALGGDGTMLRAARIGSRDATPLVGVKLVPGAHVGEEVAVPERPHAQTFVGVGRLDHLRLGIKIPLQSAILRLEGVIEI